MKKRHFESRVDGTFVRLNMDYAGKEIIEIIPSFWLEYWMNSWPLRGMVRAGKIMFWGERRKE